MERLKGMVYSGPGGAAVFEMDLDTQIGFPVGPSGRTGGNGQRLKHKKFCPNMRKHFFTLGVVRPQSRLLREAVEPPSLETFKTQVDVTMHNPPQLALTGQGLANLCSWGAVLERLNTQDMEQGRGEGRFFCGLEEGIGCMLGKAGCSPRGGVNAHAAELWIRKHGAGEGQIWVEGWDLSLSMAR